MKNKFVFLLFALITQPGVADIICDERVSNYSAVYELSEYTCASGYYLPANTDGCVACPSGAVCNGGTFTFDANNYQGLVLNSIPNSGVNNMCADNFPAIWLAMYEPNQYTCGAGYYVPANTDGCVECPVNSYCDGGTYTFDSEIDQGILSCPYSLLAPMGMWESEQCGHKLHVGDNSVYLRSAKKTTPSLNIMVDNNVFYGNMTTADVPMNINTTHKLKVKIGNTVYSVYDDTITP